MKFKSALIDADILRYEIGSIGQSLDKDTGELTVKSFDFVKMIFDEKVKDIMVGSECSNAELFLTADRHLIKMTNRDRKGRGEEPLLLEENFREAVAKSKPYKGTRKQEKPFHWINLSAYILGNYNCKIANGFEADDLIGIEHTKDPENTIICTRDKDLRMVPGWHYGWECGKNQPEFGPKHYDELGEIQLIRRSSGSKIVGGGFKFFCSQLLTGDVVDNIGGLRGVGPVKAYSLLQDCTHIQDCTSAIRSAYQEVDGDRWLQSLREQCTLLWIVREFNEDGNLKMFDVEKVFEG